MKFVLTFNTVYGQINSAITDYRLTENSPQHINSYCKKKKKTIALHLTAQTEVAIMTNRPKARRGLVFMAVG